MVVSQFTGGLFSSAASLIYFDGASVSNMCLLAQVPGHKWFRVKSPYRAHVAPRLPNLRAEGKGGRDVGSSPGASRQVLRESQRAQGPDVYIYIYIYRSV